MNAVLVDDDEICLEVEAIVLREVEEIENLATFQRVGGLMEYMRTTKVDVAFLDILMDDADGISLAMEIKMIQPECKIVFVSSSRDFALEAFQVYASGYLLKPLMEDEVRNVLANLK